MFCVYVSCSGKRTHEQKDKCPDMYTPSHCIEGSENIYFHAIFEMTRPSSYPLFVHQICRALYMCIPTQQFRIALHRPTNGPYYIFDRSVNFILSKGINYRVWEQQFDTISINFLRNIMLRDIFLPSNIIWQADADEFVDLQQFGSMITNMLERPDCDYFRGDLVDRLPRSGALINITMRTDLSKAFELRCDIKQIMEKAEFRKLILYRGDQRPWLGNHRLFCDRKFHNVTGCIKYMSERIPQKLFKMTPIPAKLPVACQLTGLNSKNIVIDHYKYVWGVQDYLEKRIDAFQKKKISWASESVKALHVLQSNNGKIDVSDSSYNCHKVL